MAKNGHEALRIARAVRPDVVPMDPTMPEMDGIECIQALIKLDPRIKILVLKAPRDKWTAIQAFKGARGFLSKSFTDDELQMALLEVFDAR